jgi:hypothetical protein
LFRYATAVLRMSEPQAYLRIHAARLARRYPAVIELFAEGALNLSTIKLLDSHLTVDNHEVLLERARNKTKREVALLIAEVAPLPDVPNQIRKLPAPAESKRSRRDRHEAQRLAAPAVLARPVEAGRRDVSEVSERLPIAFALEAPRASCTPLRPGRFKLELTASQALHDKLMQLQHLLQHQVPGGDLAVVVERACDVLLEKTMKQRFAHGRHGRHGYGRANVRHRARADEPRQASQCTKPLCSAGGAS